MDVVTRLLHRLPVKKHHHTLIKENRNEESRVVNLISREGWSPPWLDEGHIRLVLFHDHDGRGKIPVFDSKQNGGNKLIQADTLSSSNKFKEESTQSSSIQYNHTSSLNKSYQSRAQSSDSQMLGEMMFGSMPLRLVGNSVKIHYIRSQQQLILTKIFTAHHRPMPTCRVGDFSESCPLPVDNYCMDNSIGSTSDYSGAHLRIHSISPESDNHIHSNSFNHSFLYPCQSPSASLPVSLGSSYNHDSASPNQSWTHGTTPALTVPTSSLNSSLTRRLHRARSTSLENATRLYDRVLRPMDQGTTTVKKGRRYAVGLIFTIEDMNSNDRRLFQDFFFSHFTLISSHLEQLREKIEESLSGKRLQLTERITEAYAIFVNNFVTLYCTQRIKAPVWLSVVRCSHSNRKEVCRRFVSEFVSLASELDNKDSKFFLSTVLTAVLSLHLAWLSTVSKNGYATSRHDRVTSRSLAVLPDTHPYNPLWAQLGDLYGAVSDPLIVTRTIVTGKNAKLIHKLLYILTYFIRCSEIEPNSEIKRTFLEESDKNHDSRAGSTTTVTDDITSINSNSIKSLERTSDQPLMKPHPFSFGLNSFSSSLRSLSCIDAINDIHRRPVALTTSHHSFDNNSSLSSFNPPFFGVDGDYSQHNKESNDRWINENTSTSNIKTGTINCTKSQLHSNQTGFSYPSTFNFLPSSNCVSNEQSPVGSDYLVHNRTLCTCSVNSNDSIVSEPATDSGQFSDLDNCQNSRDCIVHKSPINLSTIHTPKSHGVTTCSSCPITTNSNNHRINTVCRNDFDYSSSSYHQSSIPGIKVTSDCIKMTSDNASHNMSYPVSHSLNNYKPIATNTCTSLKHNGRYSNLLSTTQHLPNHPLTSLSLTTSFNMSASSPNILDSAMKHKNDGTTFTHNKSWTGLPLLDGACSTTSCTADMCNPHFDIRQDNNGDMPMSLKIDNVNVEESLSPVSMQMISSSPTTSIISDNLGSKGMKYAKQFQDFTPIDISRCTVLPNQTTRRYSESSSITTESIKSHSRTNDISLSDFGYSLMAGFSEKYLTDFVLHGTSQPLSEFKESLISDLSSILKNPIVDLPVQHAAAIVIDTDTLSCKSFVLSKSHRTPDGELVTGTHLSSNAVHEMVQSVLLLWKMQMGPEFCLSHLEDRLMELNDKSQMLSSAILEKSDSFELSSLLQHLHSTLNTHPSDQKFLQALASTHCSDCDRNISRALQTSFIHSITCASK